ncbi:Alpha/Beta hydrolase protein, partial [Bipolaris maydis]
WKTPMFFSHGEIDYRIPISESLSAYNTCQVRGVPSQVLVFPDEGHTISRPENLAQWYKTTVQWAGRWVGHT